MTDDMSYIEGAMFIASEVISGLFSAAPSHVPAQGLYAGNQPIVGQ